MTLKITLTKKEKDAVERFAEIHNITPSEAIRAAFNHEKAKRLSPFRGAKKRVKIARFRGKGGE
jgi:hypothetical protein